MADVKFNLQQVGVTPPKLWVRAQMAILFIGTGAIGMLATTSLYEPKTINKIIFFIAIGMLIVQGIGVFLGVDPKAGTVTTISDATQYGQDGSKISTTTVTQEATKKEETKP